MTECPDCYSPVLNTDHECNICGYVFSQESSENSRKSTILSTPQPTSQNANSSSEDPWADLDLDQTAGFKTSPAPANNKTPVVHGVVVIQEGTTTETYHLVEGKTTIGRGEDNDIILTDDRVSGFHAIIYVDSSSQRYLDISSNGSLINGTRFFCDKFDLTNGSQIALGDALLTFVLIPSIG